MISEKKQNMLIILCWMMYTAAYFGRYSYQSNITLIMQDFGTDHASAGLVSTFFFFAYGIGQVINGCLCRHYPMRYIFPVAALCSSGLNLAFYIGVPFAAVKYMWLVNGLIQSIFWTSLIQILSRHLDRDHLPRAILVMSTTTTVGTLLTYAFSSCFSAIGQYRLSFLAAVIIMSAIGITWFFAYAYLTRDAACPPKAVPSAPSETTSRGRIRMAAMVLIVMLALMAVLDNLVKDGLQTWVPTILKETFGMTPSQAILLSLILPIFGVFGAAFSTVLHKKIKNYVLLCSVLFAMSTLCIAVIIATMSLSFLPILLGFGLVVLCMHAINNVITSMVPLYMREEIDSGKLAGILNGACYLGSTIASYGLGAVVDATAGWNAVFYLFLILSSFAVLAGLVYTAVSRKIQKPAAK